MECGAGGGGGGHEMARAPSLPWMTRLKLWCLVAARDAAVRRDGTFNRRLLSLVDRQARASARADRSGVWSVDVAVDAGGLWARVFSPSEAASPLPVVVYFHGGGFTLLSAASGPYDDLCRRLCRELHAVVVSPNYRLAPEHRCPAAYDDGMAVLRFLENTGLPHLTVPVDLSRCFLAGDSAGGNIAHHVARRWTAATSSPPPPNPIRLAGAMLLQPYFGGEERTESELRLDGVAPILNLRRTDASWRAFLPEGADRNHPAAHVTGEAELPEGFPPTMVVIGGLDPLQDWQRRYHAMLQLKGKAVTAMELPEAIHGFYVFPELADNEQLFPAMKAIMDRTNASGCVDRIKVCDNQ